MTIANGNNVDASDFVSTSAGGSDSGKVNKLNSAGRNPVDFNAFEGVRAYQTGASSISGSGSFSAMAFAAENFDTDTFHDNSTNNSRLTVPTGKGGKYLIGGVIKDDGTSDIAAQIKLNATTVIAQNVAEGSIVDTTCCVSTVYELAAGDYVELLGSSNGASNSSGDAQTHFWMVRLAP